MSPDGLATPVATDAEAAPKRRRLPVWAWVAIGIVAVILLVPLANIYALAALVVLVTGIVALATSSPTWLKLNSRKMAVAATATAGAVLLVAGSVSAASLAPRPEVVEPAVATGTESPTPQATSTRTSTPSPTPTPVITEEIVVEAVPFQTATTEDGGLEKGKSYIATSGVAGERTLRYAVTTLNGVEISRELISDEVTREPVTEVTAIGTYVAPPPPQEAPPQESGCDPNYADGCVPIDSDVDCAGGSGNGPSYFSGTARVVGSDIYDLDRDGNGIACQS